LASTIVTPTLHSSCSLKRRGLIHPFLVWREKKGNVQNTRQSDMSAWGAFSCRNPPDVHAALSYQNSITASPVRHCTYRLIKTMFHVPNEYRIREGILQSDDSNGNNGAFIIPFRSFQLRAIASDGMAWEHVSVSLPNRCPDPLAPPAANIAIDRVGIADIRRDHVPLASRLIDIENPIHDEAEVHRLPAWSARGPFAFGELELEGVPLRITDIRGIVTYGAHRRDSLPLVVCVGRSVPR